MSYFVNIEELSELEKDEKWNEARELLYKLWLSNKDDVNLAIRLGSECWYVLTEWEFIENTQLSYEVFINTLKEVSNYGLSRFKENDNFLWIFGYIISVSPFFFADDEEYEEFEKLGINMLKKAYMKNPENLIFKTLYLGTTRRIEEYNLAFVEITNNVASLLQGDTAIERYFINEIFNKNNIE